VETRPEDGQSGNTERPPTDAGGPPRPPVQPPEPSHEHVHPHQLAAAVEKALHVHLSRYLTEHLSKVEDLVAEGRHRVDHAVHRPHHLPAWLRPTEGEPRWPVFLAVLAAIGLQAAIPARLSIGNRWLLPALELALLLVLSIANPRRINQERRWLRGTSLVLVALASVANAWSALKLVIGLIHGREGDDAGPLLATGGAIWLTNVVVFALWYWEFDRGGPASRAHARKTYPDFQFPQMENPNHAHPNWEPTFADYLYLSFTNATAFSPTDTVPMTRWAKMAMLSQSAVSLATVALVIARAVNVLK
jgi:uncharacterized membrane protein